MRAGCLGKGSSPYNFGVTPDTGSLRGTAFPAQLPGERNNTASRAHVLVTCVQLHSTQSEWRGAHATGKETLLWDSEPPKPGTPHKIGSWEGTVWHGSASLPKGCKEEEEKIEAMRSMQSKTKRNQPFSKGWGRWGGHQELGWHGCSCFLESGRAHGAGRDGSGQEQPWLSAPGPWGEAAGCDNENPMRCISWANNRGGQPCVLRARGDSRTDRRMKNGCVPGGGGAGALPSSSFKAKYLIPACKQLVSVCLFFSWVVF